jgi:hypothetical protein
MKDHALSYVLQKFRAIVESLAKGTGHTQKKIDKRLHKRFHGPSARENAQSTY